MSDNVKSSQCEKAFLGYCFLPDETYFEPVHLSGVEAVMRYISLQLPFQHRVVICDSDDYRIFEAVDGEIIFPKQGGLTCAKNQIL